jgi:hypothetical protein
LTKDSNNTSTKTDTTNLTKDSNNTTTSTKTDTTNSTKDSNNTSTSNTDTGNTDSHAVTVSLGDVAVAVASTTLSGSVTGNTMSLGKAAYISTGYNNIDGNAFQGASGITTITQNSGVGSLIQPSVNVQSNLTMSPTH